MILSFSKDKFKQDVIHGKKITTIRRDSKRRWREGMKIHFWYSSPYVMMTREGLVPHMFGTGIAKRVSDIKIVNNSFSNVNGFYIMVNGVWVNDSTAEIICDLDGLTPRQFRLWFVPDDGDEFIGRRIHWTDETGNTFKESIKL